MEKPLNYSHIQKILAPLGALILIMGLALGCSQEPSQAPVPKTLTLMTHDSFSISKPVLDAFEKHLDAKVVILKSGDAGEALNKAILSKNNPLAQIFYGVDNTFISRALAQDIFLAYAPKGLEAVADDLKMDPENRLIPMDFGDVCINYDKTWFETHNIRPPASLEDLTRPEYKDLLVVQNPATSSPGLAFLLATVSRFGKEGYLDFWKKLVANGLLVKNGWKEAYWGEFTAASEGNRPLVVSYASSPTAEVFYADPKPATAPTGLVIDRGAAFRQVEFAGILAGTQDLELAQKAMDFMPSSAFQEDIPLQMFVFPANGKANLPGVFTAHAKITPDPARLDPQDIHENRESWIRQWTECVLQ